MTKSKFLKEIRGQRNEVRTIAGVRIANVAWLNKPWLIIENEETIEDVMKSGFDAINSYRTSVELYENVIKIEDEMLNKKV